MEDKQYQPEQIESNKEITQSVPWSKTSEIFNREHPFLSAYVGFIILFGLSGILADFIVVLLGSAIQSTFDSYILTFLLGILKLILRVVFGFYAFRYILKNK